MEKRENKLLELLKGYYKNFIEASELKGILVLFFISSFIVVLLYPFPSKTNIIFPIKSIKTIMNYFFIFWSRQYFILFGTLAFFIPLIILSYILHFSKTIDSRIKFAKYFFPAWIILSFWFTFFGDIKEDFWLNGGFLGKIIFNTLIKIMSPLFIFIILGVLTLLIIHFIYIKIPFKSIYKFSIFIADFIEGVILKKFISYIKKRREKKEDEIITIPATRRIDDEINIINWEEILKDYNTISTDVIERIKVKAKNENLSKEEVIGLLQEEEIKKKSENRN